MSEIFLDFSAPLSLVPWKKSCRAQEIWSALWSTSSAETQCYCSNRPLLFGLVLSFSLSFFPYSAEQSELLYGVIIFFLLLSPAVAVAFIGPRGKGLLYLYLFHFLSHFFIDDDDDDDSSH